MEDGLNRGDPQGNFVRQSSLRQGGTYKSTLSGRSPRNSPTFRRLNSGRTPKREGRTGGVSLEWFRSNRLVYWLLLITLWAYLGFYFQSRWAHGENRNNFLGFRNKPRNHDPDSHNSERRNLIANHSTMAIKNETHIRMTENKRTGVVLANKGNGGSSPRSVARKKNKKSSRRSRGKARKQAPKVEVESTELEEQEPEIPKKNTTYGLLVGPFGMTEDRVLGWSPEKRSGTCDRKGNFARLVWSRRFLLIFHELSMTGAPLSMMELATELLSCGATVSAVVLSRKGGLMPELVRRRIKVLEDKADFSFKVGMKSDVVIAGSAVCASWIDHYIEHFPAGGSQISWWIMENRREYFDRAKPVLNRVKMLIFLSESQSKQWLTWCEEEKIKLRYPPSVVPLSVNDELAFVAGIHSSLNTPSFSTEMMKEKKMLLRDSVRREMGLMENDMLLISLSSINPGKGQLLLLESACLVIDNGSLWPSAKVKKPAGFGKAQGELNSTVNSHLRALFQEGYNSEPVSELPSYFDSLKNPKRKTLSLPGPIREHGIDALSSEHIAQRRRTLSDSERKSQQVLKVLIGSVGSKSNKVQYMKETLTFLSVHSNLSRSVLWTPATTRVASLYSAADVYVINSQGMGETFGRVTIEAMAFGIPVLGTDAGGTKEIVDHNETGLLHPPGRQGIEALATNIQYLLREPVLREQMGMKGRKKVEKMYLKHHIYKKFAVVLSRCMR
ncbi:uncharacterized protein LOC115737981 [Rhodamnia argentea]|uniref:Uncharacterized protein LOC115737981 n=1 Tax=Rhodamnia argentea TaxID=178133 RepID=A0A8B8NUU6_9MYRT|nr:uncharacterized protein LOC115737981 [Rhodamnia argentea]